MIKLPSGVEINSLIEDLRIFSWEAADVLLYYSKILKDPKHKTDILKNDNNELGNIERRECKDRV